MTDTPMTPAREQEIRTLDLLALMSDRAAPVISGHLAALLAEVDRLRAQVAKLESATGTARAMHRKHPDSEHCQYDDMTWPCPTVTALGEAPEPDHSECIGPHLDPDGEHIDCDGNLL